MTAVDIANRCLRGLSPWPGAYTFVNGERWTLWRVQASDESSGAAPGTVTKVGKDRVEVATGRGTIHIMDIQPSNSRRYDHGAVPGRTSVRRGLLASKLSRCWRSDSRTCSLLTIFQLRHQGSNCSHDGALPATTPIG